MSIYVTCGAISQGGSSSKTIWCGSVTPWAMLEFSTCLKITTRPDLVCRFLSPNTTQPDSPAWTVCPNPALRAPALFSSRVNSPVASLLLASSIFPSQAIGVSTSRSGIRSVSASPHEAGSQTYSSPHVNSDDPQQTIDNLQPARNVFYEMCLIKKEARGPTRPGSFAYFFSPNPLWTLGHVSHVGDSYWLVCNRRSCYIVLLLARLSY